VGKVKVEFLSGQRFNKKICIKQNATLTYLNLYIPNNFGYSEPKTERVLATTFNLFDCKKVNYKPNVKITDVSVANNNYGCLTRYGWVDKRDLC